ELLAGEDGGLTQTDIAKALGRTANELYRMLDRLVRRGYIVRSASSDRYQLSLKLFSLAHRHPPMQRLISEATPVIRDLARVSEQSCHLVVYDTGYGRVVAQVDAPGKWTYSLRVGTSVPLFSTGSGHVLLAFQTDERRREMLLEHREVEGEEPMSMDELQNRIQQVRRQGYEIMDSSQILGVINISCPVFGPNGYALAALTVPYIKRIDRRPTPPVEDVLGWLSDGAQRLSLPSADVAQAAASAGQPALRRAK
ncbi:MAG: IclR family transcriptional regulator, partial [Pseudomonadota bacterium]